MAELSRTDLAGAIEVIHAAHAFDDLESFRYGLLPHMREVIPCDVAGYNEQLQNGWIVIDDPPGTVVENSSEMLDLLGHQHPVINEVKKGDLSALKISDFLTRRELHQLDLYQEVFKPIGTEDQIAVGIPAARIIGIAFNRGTSFDERDRALLNLLQPHIVQAYLTVTARERARAVIDVFENELETRGAAVILVEGSSIAYASPRAFTLLDAWFGNGARSGALPRRLADWLGASRHKLAPPITVNDERGRATVRVVTGVADAPYELLVIEEKRSGGPSPDSLRASLGLTRRQADVLALAAKGLADADIGRELGIATTTVRKHMENIHVILGVHSRSAAVVRALGG